MPHGYLVVALHAHLPYVLSHGTWPHGSDWLNEAVCETYLPLLNLLDRISNEGRKANLTMGITPILCEMLASPVFKEGLKDYMRTRIRAADKDGRFFERKNADPRALLAQRWHDLYQSLLLDFVLKYDEDLVSAFRRFQEEGQIEIIASAATHAYLPLLSLDSSVYAQIRQGIETYKKHFRRAPKGLWLPECAYRPAFTESDTSGMIRERKGMEHFLLENGIDYFFLDSHHLREQGPVEGYVENLPWRESAAKGSSPDDRGMYDMYSLHYEGLRGLQRVSAGKRGVPVDEGTRTPYMTYYTGAMRADRRCAFFAREGDMSLQVWSSQWGYPGDGDYLEFHKKRAPGGLRYWSVTDRTAGLDQKKTYDPVRAAEKVRSHAAHFQGLVTDRLEQYMSETGRTGVATTPFDAELFGHWWHEGIDWLYQVLRLFQKDGTVKVEKASTALERISPEQVVELPEGSWGAGGGHLIWYNTETEWMWDCIHETEHMMSSTVNTLKEKDAVSVRLLKQMARELFLLQASDWEFLVSTGAAKDYAEERFRTHYADFKTLGGMLDLYLKEGALPGVMIDTLSRCEERDAVFDNVKIEWFEERTQNGLQTHP